MCRLNVRVVQGCPERLASSWAEALSNGVHLLGEWDFDSLQLKGRPDRLVDLTQDPDVAHGISEPYAVSIRSLSLQIAPARLLGLDGSRPWALAWRLPRATEAPGADRAGMQHRCGSAAAQSVTGGS